MLYNAFLQIQVVLAETFCPCEIKYMMITQTFNSIL